MRRILSICITLILIFSVIPLNGNYPTIAKAKQKGNMPATFIAKILHKAGYDKDGKPIDPDQGNPGRALANGRFFPWEYTRGSSWGRKEVLMPGSPLYWFEMYLTIQADAGKSRPENRWVGVIDTLGRMWLDPDGNFHDSNYDKLADVFHPAYVAGRCENNPRAQIDPLSNTQGPYYLDPSNAEFRSEIYFYDKLITGRGWRIGWVDLVDYLAASTTGPDGIVSSGIVMEGDWDLSLPLIPFITIDSAESEIPPASGTYYPIADPGEEWHAENIETNDHYDSGESIYLLGSGYRVDPADPLTPTHNQDPTTLDTLTIRNSVQPGDIRVSMVSLTDGINVFTYAPGSVVAVGDRDSGTKLIPFVDNGNPVPEPGEEWHTGTKLGTTYKLDQFIYLKLNSITQNFVQLGDIRLTNVNTKRNKNGIVLAGISAGDVMIFSEVIEANCNGINRYDISVETDLWMGANPSVTSARLTSNNGDIVPQTQRIQKSTVLDPNGKEFIVPATTFQDISLMYREYIGVEIFADNGMDANISANLPGDTLSGQNASDDYRDGRTGEEFLGLINGNLAFDYGEPLYDFGSNVFRHVFSPPDPPYDGDNPPKLPFACGSAIYKKAAISPITPVFMPPNGFVVESWDIRLTTVTIEKAGQRITYAERSVVAPGDIDVGLNLFPMPGDIKYLDDTAYDNDSEYDEGEIIYKSGNNIVSGGDVRMTEVMINGKVYPCNTSVTDADYWVRETPVQMITMGKNGNGKAIDMKVMPGQLDMEITIDKNFKVEQTTTIHAKLNSPLKKGETVHVVVKEPEIPGFGGVPAPEASYVETILTHEWLPLVPEGEDEWTYRLGSPVSIYKVPGGSNYYAYTNPPCNGPFGTNTPYLWSDPTTYIVANYVPGYGYILDAPRTTRMSPMCGPSRGPYQFDMPTTGQGPFIFKFQGVSYRRMWVHTDPRINLNNGGGPIGSLAGPYYSVDPYMSGYYTGYAIEYPQYSPSPSPAFQAYADYYPMQAISAARFTTLDSSAPGWTSFGSQAPSHDLFGRGECGTYYGYNYCTYSTMAPPNHQAPSYGRYGNYMDYIGIYQPDKQPLTTGVWAYVDESVSPRRMVITWKVNFSWDDLPQVSNYYSPYYAYYSIYGYLRRDLVDTYPGYQVQIVLWENGTFQYNYNFGNRVPWALYTTAYNYSPDIGYYNGNKGGATANILPHHRNKDLNLAPSVRWNFYQPPGKIDPHNPWKMYADYRKLDSDNKEVSFEYTPYRGTCKEDGTRDRLEIQAFLDKGGSRTPILKDPIKDVPFDEYDLPVGIAGPYNATTVPPIVKSLPYVDMDRNGFVSTGDIRLVNVTYTVGVDTASFPLGSVVGPLDKDNAAVPYSVLTDATNVAAAQQWKIYNPANARLGGCVYVQGSDVKLLVYVDMNENGIADVGDIRLVAFSGYGQGTIVTSQDWEVYDPMTGAVKVTPLFPQRAPIGVNKKKYVYFDRDYSQTLSRFDTRLTAIDSYLDGTKVFAGELDIGTPYKAVNVPIGIHDAQTVGAYALYNDDAKFHFNVYAHLGDVATSTVLVDDIRITDCYIMQGTQVQQIYKRGSVVTLGDLDTLAPNHTFDYAYQPEILVVYNQWLSGIYADVNRQVYGGSYPSVPPGFTRPDTRDIRLVKNKFFKPTYYYMYQQAYLGSFEWDAGTCVIPQYYRYQYPYPGWYGTTWDNCDPVDGSTGYYANMYPHSPQYYAGAMRLESDFTRTRYVSVTDKNTVYINVTPTSNAVKAGDYRLMEIGALQQGTYVEIDSTDRQSDFMFDPYWAIHPWTKLELDQNPFKAVKPVPGVQPNPTMPKSIKNQYDCYAWFKYDIAPEEYDLETESPCIPLNPQRFPNVNIRIKDHDNPNDVNDPAHITVSGHGDEPMVMNFNAHGGGIKFFFTSVAEPPSYQKYIGQYNEDDTVVFWYWYDNVPYGVLDTNDYLKNTYDINKTGTFKPVGSDPYNQYWMLAPPFPARVWDIDCSFNQTVCTIPGDKPGFPKLGEVNNRFYYFAFDMGDVNGRTIWNMGDHIINQGNQAPSFNGLTTDPQIIYCSSRGDASGNNYCAPRRYGSVWTYGVPVSVTNWTDDDEGGRMLVPIKPFKTDTPVTVRIYSARVLYDYNSRYPHGPAFLHDTGPGIDYVGLIDLKVLEPDPKLNFGEFQMIDHSLQNSKVNYTTGTDALSPMIYPTPRLHADYDPMLIDFNKDIRAYPGGNTHSGRIPTNQFYSGFNAYKSLWPNMYNKLGTEMFPFTDYGIAFILHDGFDNRIYWDPNVQRPDLNLKSITVEGPFMTPRIFERFGGTGALTQTYKTNYPSNLPLQYDFSGKIQIDISNYNLYSSMSPPDLTQRASPWSTDSILYTFRNQRLIESKKMWYYGRFTTVTQYMLDNGNSVPPGSSPTPLNQVIHFIDEIIPISNGKISITVQLYDGTIKKYEDCCNEIFDNLPVNALEVTSDVATVTVDTDSKVQVKVNEYDTKSLKPSDHTVPCNDALVLMWQDRGVKDQTGKMIGAGDGWITVPPRSSSYSSSGSQLNKQFDINDDGKVSFNSFETEIIGTYDIASNTWKAGMIDARSFQRNEGIYVFDLSAENGALIDTVGNDFGGPVSNKNMPDHVIDDFELLPLYITAFKYGDDDNDRAFSPYYSLSKPYEFSHEVYASGLKPIDVVPKNDWVVSSTPDILTAGCVSELLQAETPLTFNVLDGEGNPVDLSVGIKDPSGNDVVDNINIWNVLIKDPHPDNKLFYGTQAKLPQYYWLRTDLHNDDGTLINNYRQFSISRNPFLPIVTDFTGKKDGKYVFKGFCANDEGTMKVYVDSPDRKHRGVVDVTVKSPSSGYVIMDEGALMNGVYNQVAPGQAVGGDTDYILTTHNFSSDWQGCYRIFPFIYDATGAPIVGSKSVDCETNVTSLTRFTPYNTKPYNFDFYSFGYTLYTLPEITRSILVPNNYGGRYLNVGWREDEKNPNYLLGSNFGGFPLWNKPWTTNYALIGGVTFYNTTNWRWENGTYELLPLFDVPPANYLKGYGRGAIYNSPKKGGYLFPDWNGTNGYLDWRDSILVNEPGKQWFMFAANDAMDYGGLVGKNPYSNGVFADVVGGLRNYRNITTYPDQVRYRYSMYQSDTIGYSNGDGSYRLDWDAFATGNGKARHPKMKVINETTGAEYGKDLLNTDNYDLIYGKPNHIRLIVSPNSSPNTPIFPYRRIRLSSLVGGTNLDIRDAAAENYIEARTEMTGVGTQLSIDGTTEALLRITPTGLWNDLAQVVYLGTDFNLNERFAFHMADFDVIKNVKVVAKTSGKLYANQPATLLLYVMEQGDEKPVAGASVVVKGPGVSGSGKSDKEGLLRLEITPTGKGIIEIRVSHPDLGEAYTEVPILEEGNKETFDIMMQPLVTITNQQKMVLSGSTNIGCRLTINNEPVPVTKEGTFSWEVTLKEGENIFVMEATDDSGRKVRKVLTVIRDTLGPIIELTQKEKFYDVREIELQGVLSEDGNVLVNNKPAVMSGRNWKATLPVNFGKNVVKITANDTLGNQSEKSFEVLVYKKMEVKLSIGKKVVFVNGLEQEQSLSVAPYIKKESTFVPIRLISESFGAKVEWLPQVKGIVIEFMDKKIEMQIGSKTAIVNGKTVMIDNPPESTKGVTFVPLRFIADAMGAKTQWIPQSRDIIITIFAY